MENKKLKLRMATVDDDGWMNFLQELPVHVSTLERFWTSFQEGKTPSRDLTVAAVTALVAFALDEPDKEAARQTILNELNGREIADAVIRILAVAKDDADNLQAQAAMRQMKNANAGMNWPA